MKIAQISDLHITEPGEVVCGVDAGRRLLDLLSTIQEFNLDHLLVTGDLCSRGAGESIYKWIKNQLDDALIPYSVIPGNHDDSSVMARVFGYDGFTFDKMLGTQKWYFLDTSCGYVSPNDMEWVHSELTDPSVSRAMIVMHHPPCLCSVPHMDRKYYLQNHEVMLRLLSESKKIIHVFCGHYHVAKTLQFQDVTIHLCPSTNFQINSQKTSFEGIYHLSGYILIRCDEDWMDVEFKFMQ